MKDASKDSWDGAEIEKMEVFELLTFWNKP